jgi:TonB family protein
MKQIIKILSLVLLVIISCKNKNDNKIKSISFDKKNDSGSASLIRKVEPDNYIIDSTSNLENGPVYMYCETMPEFPGGKTAFNEYVKNNVRYSPRAVADKIEGRVIIKFIVNTDGEIGNVKIIRGVRDDLDKECLRVISGMPRWKPGMISGKPVPVSYSIPVRFLLNSGENLNGIFILPAKNPSLSGHKNIP